MPCHATAANKFHGASENASLLSSPLLFLFLSPSTDPAGGNSPRGPLQFFNQNEYVRSAAAANEPNVKWADSWMNKQTTTTTITEGRTEGRQKARTWGQKGSAEDDEVEWRRSNQKWKRNEWRTGGWADGRTGDRLTFPANVSRLENGSLTPQGAKKEEIVNGARP